MARLQTSRQWQPIAKTNLAVSRVRNILQGSKLRSIGVTLVELVVTIVIMGILAGGTVAFVMSSTQSYVDTATRNQLSALGRLSTIKLGRALKLAVPNSIRVTDPKASGDQCIEYFPIASVSSYREANFSSESTSLTLLPFNALSGTKHVVIFPTAPLPLYSPSSPGPLATITNYSPVVSGGIETLTLNPPHQFNSGSVTKRIFLAEDPVSFCVEDGKLFRYRGYGIRQQQCTPDTTTCLPETAPDRALIVDSIDNSGIAAFEVSAALQSMGMVRATLNFSDGDEVFTIRHEIQVPSTP